jgi:predicted RNA-binding protein YlqC (UPF0109 family)
MTDLDPEYDEADVNTIDAPDTGRDADAGDIIDDDDDEDEVAPTAISVLDLLVCSLVDDPDAVRIDAKEQRGKVRLEVRVGDGDMGRVIGKRGRVATAIRTDVSGRTAAPSSHELGPAPSAR